METQVINTPDKTFILMSNSVGIGMSVTVIDFKGGNPSSKLYESFSDMPAELRAELTLAQAVKSVLKVFDENKYQH